MMLVMMMLMMLFTKAISTRPEDERDGDQTKDVIQIVPHNQTKEKDKEEDGERGDGNPRPVFWSRRCVSEAPLVHSHLDPSSSPS